MAVRNGTTSEKQRADMHQYYVTHKEERREYQRRWRAANAVRVRLQHQIYAVTHKEEIDAHRREYRMAHRAEIAATHRAYALVHKDEIQTQRRAYRAAHKEEINAKNRAYRAAHREKLLAYTREWRAQHPEEIAALGRAYRAAHPEVQRNASATRRAREKGALINDLSAAQWQEIQAAYNYRCAYCPPTCWWCQHKKHALTRDHIDALVNGGNHTVANIVPACRKHNCQKQAGPVLKPVQPLLLTIAPAKKKKKG